MADDDLRGPVGLRDKLDPRRACDAYLLATAGMLEARAAALFQTGRKGEAVNLLEAVIAGLESTGELTDKLGVDGRVLLAKWYALVGRDPDAQELYRALLPDVQRVYGPDHEIASQIRQELNRPRWRRRKR